MPKPKDTLDSIDIKSPCAADWDEMVGNDQVRFCSHCNLSVHDLSTMTRKEAMQLIIKSKGKLCARYVRRPDGRVQTTDLVLHQISAVKRRVSRLAAGAFTAALSISASVVAATPAFAQTTGEAVASTQMVQGRLKINHGSGATLTGTIKDPNGAIVAGATLRLVNEMSAFEQTTTTNDEGVYSFQAVEEGSYTLRIEAAGFAYKEVNNITLRAGEEQSMDETLEIGGVMGGLIVVTTPEQPLLSAVLTDDVDEVKRLLAAGADVNVLDDGINSTALAQAVQRDNRELLKILLNAGADVNEKNHDGQTALMSLNDETSVEIVQDLLAAGAKIDLADESGQTALHHAASFADTEILQALIDAGARIDATDESNRTALMMAAQDGNEDNVAALLKAGASVNLRDEDDKTAFGMAKENDHNEVCDLLASYGGVE
jgi:uncharacterized cupredoxin-like copper-binding protein